jgi:hypothetical protein
MPEDEAPLAEETPEAPEAEAPEGTPSEAPAVDYEKRYNDLRSEFDSRNQRYSQYEQFIGNLNDPATQAEALRVFGIELQEEGEPEEELPGDPEERWEQRFNQIEAHLQQQADKEAEGEVQALEKEYLDKSIADIEKAEGVKFSDKERKALERLGEGLRDEDGIPDYEEAHKLLSETAEERRKRYMETKKSEVPGVGTAGSEKVDMTDADSRVNAFANIMEAGEQA